MHVYTCTDIHTMILLTYHSDVDRNFSIAISSGTELCYNNERYDRYLICNQIVNTNGWYIKLVVYILDAEAVYTPVCDLFTLSIT